MPSPGSSSEACTAAGIVRGLFTHCVNGTAVDVFVMRVCVLRCGRCVCVSFILHRHTLKTPPYTRHRHRQLSLRLDFPTSRYLWVSASGLPQVRVAEDIGIDTVVRLAQSDDTHVQRHAAGAIANLAFENAAMELRLVTEGVLPPLLALARSPDAQVSSALMRELLPVAADHQRVHAGGACD